MTSVGGPLGPNCISVIRLFVTKGRRATFAKGALGNVGRAGLKPLLRIKKAAAFRQRLFKLKPGGVPARPLLSKERYGQTRDDL